MIHDANAGAQAVVSRTGSEFRTNGWTAIHSGTTARADGVMTLVHPKHPSARVRYEEVTPGRVLRAQVQMPT